MSERRKAGGALWGGVAIAAGLSGVFVGLTVLTSPLVAALVVVPTAVVVGAVRARHVPRATPHSLVEPTYESRAVIDAPRASDATGEASTGSAPGAA